MDIGKILSEIKGKVLDAAHFELLESAYELQNQNIEQLKENNSAIKEKSALLQEKATHLEKENNELKARVEDLESQLANHSGQTEAIKLSEVAVAILRVCIERDITDFYSENMITVISFTRMQTEAAIEELEEKGLVALASVGPDGSNYYVTSEGKKFALEMS